MIVAELVFASERYIRDVAPGARLTTDAFAEIVHNNVVKAGIPLSPFRDGSINGVNPVEHLNQFEDAYSNASFFEQFPSDSLFQSFAKLQCAARYGPLATQRLTPAANQ
jgi:hypothetical protein